MKAILALHSPQSIAVAGAGEHAHFLAAVFSCGWSRYALGCR